MKRRKKERERERERERDVGGKRDEIEARAQEIHPRLQLARIHGWKRDR